MVHFMAYFQVRAVVVFVVCVVDCLSHHFLSVGAATGNT
jgi:hypothetical protein